MITNQMSFVDNLSDQLLILFYFVTDAEKEAWNAKPEIYFASENKPVFVVL